VQPAGLAVPLTCVRKQLGHVSDAPDVLSAVGSAESQVLVEPMADVIPVQQAGQVAPLVQQVLQSTRNSRLATTAQPCSSK
jgi:hypothetical protein